MSIDNLQRAITNAVADVRSRHAELTPTDVDSAYFTFREHFEQREDDPPVSRHAAMDELLLAIWDVIVDRETDHLDQPEGDLEDYYVTAFTGLLKTESSQDREQPPIAMPEVMVEDTSDPAPVEVELGAPDDAGSHPIQVEQAAQPGSVYKIHVTLDGSEPAIWREILIPADTSETQVHHYIQAAMGWPGTDDFLFTPSKGAPSVGSGEPILRELLPTSKDDCGYEFDHWYHNVHLRETQEPDGKRHYPVCTGGKGACPPVDSNVKEYNQRVRILRDPAHPDYEEVAGWVTQDFNPETFNIDQANRQLGQYGNSSFQAVK